MRKISAFAFAALLVMGFAASASAEVNVADGEQGEFFLALAGCPLRLPNRKGNSGERRLFDEVASRLVAR